MKIVATLAGLILIAIILRDGFETIILPRRVTRRLRLTSLFYTISWIPWRKIGKRWRNRQSQDNFFSFYGPLSTLGLLVIWAVSLVTGYALLEWGLSLPVVTVQPENTEGLGTYLYMSGVTFFTLGFGDITPHSGLGRLITVAEAGTGFGFLGLVIGYVPTIYSAFSQREVNVSMLDARAGSPPSAVEMLRRHAIYGGTDKLTNYIEAWESWAAQLLESHLSYPVLCYFRSQHENQSWVAALTSVLDTCALIITGIEGVPNWTAYQTFAIARHTAVDLTQIFKRKPLDCPYDRLPATDISRMRAILTNAGIPLRAGPDADQKLRELRDLYEPYLVALSQYLVMDLPDWLPPENVQDNWQSTAWRQSNQAELF